MSERDLLADLAIARRWDDSMPLREFPVHAASKDWPAAVLLALRYRAALHRIASAAGNPDPAEGCRVILGLVKEALGE